jgi:hypothetical protein
MRPGRRKVLAAEGRFPHPILASIYTKCSREIDAPSLGLSCTPEYIFKQVVQSATKKQSFFHAATWVSPLALDLLVLVVFTEVESTKRERRWGD